MRSCTYYKQAQKVVQMKKTMISPVGAARIRRYFEPETCFQDALEVLPKILEAYEQAAYTAAHSARSAISVGEAEFAHNALWDECIAETLEKILSLFPISSCPVDGSAPGNESFTPPERPHFKP